MTVIHYSLTDTDYNEKEFDTVKDALKWMMGIGEDMFTSVNLTDSKGNCVSGFNDIVQSYSYNNDMWAGDEDCIHLHTSSGIGGGQQCDTCPAWFCY